MCISTKNLNYIQSKWHFDFRGEKFPFQRRSGFDEIFRVSPSHFEQNGAALVCERQRFFRPLSVCFCNFYWERRKNVILLSAPASRCPPYRKMLGKQFFCVRHNCSLASGSPRECERARARESKRVQEKSDKEPDMKGACRQFFPFPLHFWWFGGLPSSEQVTNGRIL